MASCARSRLCYRATCHLLDGEFCCMDTLLEGCICYRATFVRRLSLVLGHLCLKAVSAFRPPLLERPLVEGFPCLGHFSVVDLHSEIVDAPLPWGPNSFNFVQFLGKFGKIVCWCPLEGWCPHLRDILDLSLLLF